MEVLKIVSDRKYSDVYMIAGSDRVSEFKRLITQYNGKDFNFDKTEVVDLAKDLTHKVLLEYQVLNEIVWC